MSHNDQHKTKNGKNEQKTQALEINYSYSHAYIYFNKYQWQLAWSTAAIKLLKQ